MSLISDLLPTYIQHHEGFGKCQVLLATFFSCFDYFLILHYRRNMYTLGERCFLRKFHKTSCIPLLALGVCKNPCAHACVCVLSSDLFLSSILSVLQYYGNLLGILNCPPAFATKVFRNDRRVRFFFFCAVRCLSKFRSLQIFSPSAAFEKE